MNASDWEGRYISPRTGAPLYCVGVELRGASGESFPIKLGIPRFVDSDGYSASFGYQWQLFRETQLGEQGYEQSRNRFFAVTGWNRENLLGNKILEVGSGAGRFSKVVLKETEATLYSIDYSAAVDANYKSNGNLASERFHICQASVYEMPFQSDSFDKVFCFGVLQHTPDFSSAIRAIVEKAKRDGEIVVDFYPIKGWWTKLHAKYLLRPFTRRLEAATLLRLIRRNVRALMALYFGLHKLGLGVLARFVPICDIYSTIPPGLSAEMLREWVILDTFDMFSPRYDNPQRVSVVRRMFERSGASVSFAGYVEYGDAVAAVVRARKL